MTKTLINDNNYYIISYHYQKVTCLSNKNLKRYKKLLLHFPIFSSELTKTAKE